MRGALRQGKLPPQAFDTGNAAFVLDRLAELLVDNSHLGRGGRSAVPYTRKAEEIGWKLRAARMDNESSTHSEDSAKKAGFEDDIISRRSLTGLRLGQCQRTVSRPVVLSERECREVDFMGKLEEAFQCGGPRIEGCRPGFYVRDVFEPTCQCLEQLLLFSRRAYEDARFVHQFLQIADRPRLWTLPLRPYTVRGAV